MKTAIILNGNIRTWKDTKDSFKETFKHFDYDLYVSTYDLQYQYHPHIQNVIQDSGDVLLTTAGIEALFADIPVKKLVIESAMEVSKLVGAQSTSFDYRMKDSDTSFAQYRKFHNAIDDMSQVEMHENFKYDIVIKTRCDLVYNAMVHELHVRDKLVTVDQGNVFPNDCIFIGTRNDIFNISQFMYYEFFNPVYDDSNKDSPHGLLKNACKYNECAIMSLPLIKHVLRKDGKIQHY